MFRDSAPMQLVRQMLHFCLSALLLFAGIMPFGLQLNAACGTGTSSSMEAMTGVQMAHISSIRVEPCPETSSNCTMIAGCCLPCPVALAAMTGEATLEHVVLIEQAFTAFNLTLRNRSTNVADPPPRA